MRQPEPQRRQAVLLDAGHFAEGAACVHRAGTSDHSRSRRCRAAATPACRRRAPRLLRDDRRARPRTARRRNARLRCVGRGRAALLQQPLDPRHRGGKILVRAGPARRDKFRARRRAHRPPIRNRRRRPEAARPCAAATALIRALAAKVSPVSSGSPRPSSPADTASTPCGASNSRISASLPGLWVAITSLPVIRRCMRHVYVGALAA